MIEFFIWVLCIVLLLSAGALIGASLVLHSAPKQKPPEEVSEADRNFSEYMDKVNKDVDRI